MQDMTEQEDMFLLIATILETDVFVYWTWMIWREIKIGDGVIEAESADALSAFL